MDLNWLIALLKESGSSLNEQAERMVSEAGSDSPKNLEAVFRIALGTGVLSKKRAEQLLTAIERMTTGETLATLTFPDDPIVAKTQREIEALSKQHDQIRLTHANLVAQREAVNALEAEVTAKRQKVRECEEEMNALQEHLARLEALSKEFS